MKAILILALASIWLLSGCDTGSGGASIQFGGETQVSVPDGVDVTYEEGNITSVTQVPTSEQDTSGNNNYIFTCAEGAICTINIDNSDNDNDMYQYNDVNNSDSTHTPTVVVVDNNNTQTVVDPTIVVTDGNTTEVF